jgi:hypothetical protein
MKYLSIMMRKLDRWPQEAFCVPLSEELTDLETAFI